MSGRISAATERALARIEAGQSAYSAAKAEGIALSTIYRAIKRAALEDAARMCDEADKSTHPADLADMIRRKASEV